MFPPVKAPVNLSARTVRSESLSGSYSSHFSTQELKFGTLLELRSGRNLSFISNVEIEERFPLVTAKREKET